MADDADRTAEAGSAADGTQLVAATVLTASNNVSLGLASAHACMRLVAISIDCAMPTGIIDRLNQERPGELPARNINGARYSSQGAKDLEDYADAPFPRRSKIIGGPP